MPLIFPHGFFPAKLSPAGTGGLLDNEANGFAAEFDVDTHLSTTGFYGSVVIKDEVNSENNFNGVPLKVLTYTTSGPKLLRGPNGQFRYNAHNYALFSEDVSQWEDVANLTAVDEETFLETNDEGAHFWGQYHLSIEDPCKFSIEVKYHGRQYAVIWLNGQHIGIDLINKQLYALDSNVWGTSLIDADIEELDDGWLRIYTPDALEGMGFFELYNIEDEQGIDWIYTGNPSVGIKVRKLHVYLAPADDTYIKTEGTFAYDLPYEWDENGNPLGIKLEDDDELYVENTRYPSSSTELTLFVQFNDPLETDNRTRVFLSSWLSPGIGAQIGQADEHWIGAGTRYVASCDELIVQAALDLGEASPGVYKIAAGYKTDDFAASLNGGSAVVATSGTFPDLTEGWLMIGLWGIPGAAANAYIQKVMALPRRMSNFELEELTAS